MKKVVLLIIVCFMLTGCFNYTSRQEEVVKRVENYQSISYKDVFEIVDNYKENPNIDIIDLRDEDTYNESHIEGSINIPYNELLNINISTDRDLIVYSDTTNKARRACIELDKQGYKSCKYMASVSKWPYDLEEGEVEEDD